MIFKFATKTASIPRLWSAMLRIAQAFEKTFSFVQIEKDSFFRFLRCAKSKKIAFTLADRAFGIKRFNKQRCWN